MKYIYSQPHREIHLSVSPCPPGQAFRFGSPISFAIPIPISQTSVGSKKLDNLLKERAQMMIDNIHPDFIICTTAWKPEVIGLLKGKAKKIMESHCAREYMAISDNFSRGCVRDLFDRYAARTKFCAVRKYCDVLVTLTVSDARSWAKDASSRYVSSPISHRSFLWKTVPTIMCPVP